VTDAVSARRSHTVTRSARWTGVVLVATLPFAAACGAGKSNENEKERATPYAATATVGAIAVRAARLVPSTAVPAASSAATPTDQGYLVVAIVNKGTQPDALSNATVSGGTVQPGSATQGSLTLPPRSLVTYGDPASGYTGPTLTISGLANGLTVGTTVPMTLTFAHAGTVSLDVPVMESGSFGSTATAAPIATTGAYPSATSTP
jgi:copper(I)-binding protein